MRLQIRRVGLLVAMVATVWALMVWLSGGLTIEPLGVSITSRNSIRSFVVALAGWVVFFAAGGRIRMSLDRAAVGLAALTFVLGVGYATTAVGGSDSYGYASQADLWLGGRATIEQPWIADVPWPDAAATFAPLGYWPSPKPDEPSTLIPIYPPGLPWIMAAAKLAGGQEAMFWVSPIFGALLVLATYGIARCLVSSAAGLLAAWLVATSPAMLFMLVVPMSDVPAAGAWAVAWYFVVCGAAWRAAAAAGAATAIAIAIRPNLVFGAAIIGCWYALRVWLARDVDRRDALRRGVAFVVAALPGIAAIALVNHALNGSPFRSGYGEVAGWFAAANFWPNLTSYAGWIAASQTPIALAGMAALAVPARRLWPALQDRALLAAIAAFVVCTWVFYCFYWRFDDWWALRLLLPIWPFMMAGLSAMTIAVARRAPSAIRVVIVMAALVYGAYEIRQASMRLAFDLWKNDRHYPAVARLVAAMTVSRSVIVSRQHSGSVRYYAGRVTLRYDVIEPQWLERAVAWLGQRDIRAYLLVDAWEIAEMKKRFNGERVLAQLDRSPLFDYRGPTNVLLFDLSRPSDAPPVIVRESYVNLRSVRPVPLVVPSFK